MAFKIKRKSTLRLRPLVFDAGGSISARKRIGLMLMSTAVYVREQLQLLEQNN
jgi:hypothetical protein